MKKYILLAIISTALLAIYFAYTLYNKPHRNIAKETATYTLTANELFNNFEKDEKKSNEKYLDKTIAISGKIIDIYFDMNNKTVLVLEAENAILGGVLCTIEDKNIKFKKNTEVKLKCKCTGFLTDVIMIECSKID